VPTISDFLFQAPAGTTQPLINQWVRLVNNSTSTAYVSTAATTTAGLFTVNNVPAGLYTVYTGPTSTGAWAATGDANYEVAPANLNWFNVKDYGALGDGATDDSAAIQAADTAAVSSGGVVFFPAATYIATALTLDSKTHWVGSGIESTIIKLKNSSATTAALISTANFTTLASGGGGLGPGTSTGGAYNFSIRDLTLDGNKANNGSNTVPMLRIYGYGFILQNLRVRNGNNDGLYSEWTSTAGSPGQDSMEAQLINIKVHDCGNHNVNWNGPHDSQWTQGIVYNATARGVTIGANGNGLLMNGVHSWGNSQTYAFYLSGSACGLVNCIGEGASISQVGINASDCWIHGGDYFGAGAGAPVGIRLGDASQAAGTHINTKILNCTTGAFWFFFEAQNFIQAHIYQTSGSVYAGTPNSNTTALCDVTGGATAPSTLVQIPTFARLVGGVATKVKAGTPVDGDFSATPPDGTLVADTTGNKIWVRVGGVWKGVTVA
jgi:hypothetical protein